MPSPFTGDPLPVAGGEDTPTAPIDPLGAEDPELPPTVPAAPASAFPTKSRIEDDEVGIPPPTPLAAAPYPRVGCG